jgi:hypothetical protein
LVEATLMERSGFVACLKCGRPADIQTIALDAPTVSLPDRTMHLCVRHFWDWNAHSLARRGHHDEARSIWALIDAGKLDQAPNPRRDHEVRAYERRMFLD